MEEDKTPYYIIILIMGVIIYALYQKVVSFEAKVEDLSESSILSLTELRFCQGEVNAYGRAFDYHVVLSELGLYPEVREEIYRFTEKEKGKRKEETNEQRTKDKD